jgi:hypothetical protein
MHRNVWSHICVNFQVRTPYVHEDTAAYALEVASTSSEHFQLPCPGVATNSPAHNRMMWLAAPHLRAATMSRSSCVVHMCTSVPVLAQQTLLLSPSLVLAIL